MNAENAEKKTIFARIFFKKSVFICVYQRPKNKVSGG
jgi:hypothetical protein